MNVEILNGKELFSEYLETVSAARQCYESFDKSGEEEDFKLLMALARNGHHSVFEHIRFHFKIEGISRTLLQQLARHRHLTLSVKSTRFTLHKMLNEFKEHLNKNSNLNHDIVSKYFVKPEMVLSIVDFTSKKILEIENDKFKKSMNDTYKYLFPEALKTNLRLTVNMREFCWIYFLRSDGHAMEEFRNLVGKMFNEIEKSNKKISDLILKVNEKFKNNKENVY